ncbi:MAG: M18 family aminopeptidase [Lachnospiraceae bacterium]|nr:M18 family aminopeptidase [Lachnospiraceae bacterium]
MQEMQELMQFLDNSLTSYHAVREVEKQLKKGGFESLSEKKIWKLESGKAYYVIRNDSSLMAFRVPDCKVSEIEGFRIFAAHTDSPAFKIKESAEMEKEGNYVVLNTEKYGGMILSTWMDRPLTIAGRVCLGRDGEIVSYPIKLADNICMIPNLAIHMNRDMNNGVALNPQIDMLPLYTMKQGEQGYKTLKGMVAEVLSKDLGETIQEKDILGSDLFVENCEKAVLAGVEQEFIMTPRYDDLGCVYGGLKGMLNAKSAKHINVLAIFDNEEVGSLTRQGADSTFLRDTLDNIATGLDVNSAILRTWIAGSFLLSADNAHACHPNQPGKADPTNKPFLNKGIVLKYHGSQKYATDAYSAAFVKLLCEKYDVPVQTYANRSDIAGGSTLGNLAMAQVSMPAADIGLPQFAMHSAYETAGVKDMEYLIRLAKNFFA